MRKQSPQERARRERRRVLFAAGLCLQDCGRPRSRDENLCRQCSDALCEQYFARIGQPRPDRVTA